MVRGTRQDARVGYVSVDRGVTRRRKRPGDSQLSLDVTHRVSASLNPIGGADCTGPRCLEILRARERCAVSNTPVETSSRERTAHVNGECCETDQHDDEESKERKHLAPF